MVNSEARPSVLVVEDELIVAKSVQGCLQQAGFHVPKLAASGREALRIVSDLKPDVIVMDIKLPGDLDGIDTAAQIGKSRQTPIVYLTAYSDADTLRRAATTDVAGYLLKPFAERQLLTTVRMALSKAGTGPTTSRSRAKALEDGVRSIAAILNDLARGDGAQSANWESSPRVAALTARERETLRLVFDGARVPTIARVLGVSQHTVRNHLKSVFRKIGVHSQPELFEWLHDIGRA